MSLYLDIVFFASYFFILIVFLTIAIISAKKSSAWIWYSIGAAITFFALINNNLTINNTNDTWLAINDPSIYWMIYIILLLISGVIIYTRYSISQDNSPKFYELYPEDPDLNIKKIDKPKKIHTKKPHPFIKKILSFILKFLICIILFALCLLVAEILLMLVLGNSIEGAPALILLFIVSILLFALLYYLFIGRKNKNSKINLIDFEKIDSRSKARAEFRKGNLEILYLLSPLFGGSKSEDNILYVPVGVNKLKKSYDNIIDDLLEEGKIKTYNCIPEYKGISFIPSKITITAGKDGNVVLQETINIW